MKLKNLKNDIIFVLAKFSSIRICILDLISNRNLLTNTKIKLFH